MRLACSIYPSPIINQRDITHLVAGTGSYDVRPEQECHIGFSTHKDWCWGTRLASGMLEITFTDQRETFFPGQEINGHLKLNPTSETQVTSKVA